MILPSHHFIRVFVISKTKMSAHFSSTYTKIGTIKRRLAWPLHKNDMQIREAFHIFKNKWKKKSEMKVLVTQSCPTLCNNMDSSPPGSCVHGILQARILEWVVIPFSRGSSQSKDWTWVSCIAVRFYIIWTTR